jgi:alpha-1,2-mannosyltransferase
MSRQRLTAVVIAVMAMSVLVAYAVMWVTVTQAHIGGSDFTGIDVGGTLLREGHGAGIYDQALQAPLHAALIAPATGGNLAFVSPPPAAVLVLPLTLLPLTAAYRIYQVSQLLMLALAVVIVARTAPWPDSARRRSLPLVAAVVALAGEGTLAVGLLGQWDGLSALGLAAAYTLWRRDARFAGGAVLAMSAAIAKPHLALGLAALLIGWRERRVLAGAATGVAAMLAVSLVAVGPAGLSAFVASTQADASRWPMASMLGFTGLFASWLGDGGAAYVLAAVGTALALGGCLLVGRRLARDRSALEPCLAAATLLSLLASPHLLTHDLVLLAPVLVALVAWAAARDGAIAWPGPRGRTALAGWLVLCLAAAIDLGAQTAGPPGRLVPVVLLGLAGTLIWHLRSDRKGQLPAPGTLALNPAAPTHARTVRLARRPG